MLRSAKLVEELALNASQISDRLVNLRFLQQQVHWMSILTLQFCQPSMGVDLPLLSSTNLQWNKLAGVLAYLQGQMVILQAQVLCFAT